MDNQTPEVPEDHDLTAQYPEDLTARYPLQLVATVAAKLLTSPRFRTRKRREAGRNEYEEAAARALDLVEACDDELYLRREGSRTLLTFHEALTLITGKEREEDALPLYRRLRRDNFFKMFRNNKYAARDPESLERNADDSVEFGIKQERCDGMPLLVAREMRLQFKEWYARRKSASARARGKLGAEVRRKKKLGRAKKS